ncbi:hypothetical protein BSKO_07328 [Bryopsis sp. KO-2023]|nr:hypothetical protein BSKO_07328 [Bryopsis sp. KO-2023]
MLAQRATLVATITSSSGLTAARHGGPSSTWRRQYHRAQTAHTFVSWNRRVRVRASEDSEGKKAVATNAADDDEEDPIWVKREKMKEVQKESGTDLPFFVYLLAAGVVAIAAVGSVFEYFEKNAVFGVIQPDSPFWLPILAFFSLTGLPVSGLLFFKAVESANKAAEQMDEVDRL